MARKSGGGSNKSGGGSTTASVITLTGTNGDDTLSAIGGTYVLDGGRGSDTYIVDGTDDSIKERGNDIDSVYSSVSWTLDSGLENLTLTGSSNLDGTGNTADNILIGNSGDNQLFGMDGDDTLDGAGGSDLLDGGAGTDTAVFAGTYADYTFAWSGTDLLVTSTTGETDILRNIELLMFADQTVEIASIPTGIIQPPAQQADLLTANDSVTLTEDASVIIDVLANDTGSNLSVTSVDYTGNGTVTINTDGTLRYDPAANWSGTESFSYTVSDANGATSTANVQVNVTPVNDAPVANNNSYSVDGSSSYSGSGLLTNDFDADGDSLTVVDFDGVSANGGAVTVNTNGTFSYTAADGFSGSDSFTYTISDGNGGT
ncbi:MAG TPA: Ig-like domain-containing protein, partial [Paracoccaceae bacterium]|nr:Ig-like domain-containing protein [Paracoccaceae bacterium]